MASVPTQNFIVGSCYSADQIQFSLEVGNAGGVRVSLHGDGTVKRMVVLTSVPTARHVLENPYCDRIEGDVLVYTGAGLVGNQTLGGVNKRIIQQTDDEFPIYSFELIGSRRDKTIGPNRWRFIGLLQFLRHYTELQFDVDRKARKVWLFEFLVHNDPAVVTLKDEFDISRDVIAKGRNHLPLELENGQVVGLRTENQADEDQEQAISIEEQRRKLLAVQPREFEFVVRDALIHCGFDRVHVTKFSQDGGVDVNASAGRRMWPIKDLLLQVQAKRWLHTVGRKEVAELRGSLQPFARGAVITTSHFSKAALNEANEDGKNPIVLVDGYSFAAIVRSMGGIKV